MDWKKSEVLFRYVQLDSKANEFYQKHKEEIEDALHDYEEYKKKTKGKKCCETCIHYITQLEYWDNPRCKISKIPDCPDNNYPNYKAKKVKKNGELTCSIKKGDNMVAPCNTTNLSIDECDYLDNTNSQLDCPHYRNGKCVLKKGDIVGEIK